MAFTTPKAKGAGPTPDVNITPLVDVALVILIIFMVVAPLVTSTFQVAISPHPKDGGPPPDKPEEPLVLSVDDQGIMRLASNVVTEKDLAASLGRELSRDQTRVLNVQASDRVAYGTVAHALDLSRAAGAKRIAIVTRPLESAGSTSPR